MLCAIVAKKKVHLTAPWLFQATWSSQVCCFFYKTLYLIEKSRHSAYGRVPYHPQTQQKFIYRSRLLLLDREGVLPDAARRAALLVVRAAGGTDWTGALREGIPGSSDAVVGPYEWPCCVWFGSAGSIIWSIIGKVFCPVILFTNWATPIPRIAISAMPQKTAENAASLKLIWRRGRSCRI